MIVCVLDWLFLGRELPSPRAVAALVLVIVGAVGYMQNDSKFKLIGFRAYFWAILYLINVVGEMVISKQILASLGLQSPVWSCVLLTNSLAVLPMLALATSTEEYSKFEAHMFLLPTMALLLCASSMGILVGWSSWQCRNMVSATTFTLLGVTSKLLTILINSSIWNQHATLPGISCLCVCLLGSTVYEQAPLRQDVSPSVTSVHQGSASDAKQETVPATTEPASKAPRANAGWLMNGYMQLFALCAAFGLLYSLGYAVNGKTTGKYQANHVDPPQNAASLLTERGVNHKGLVRKMHISVDAAAHLSVEPQQQTEWTTSLNQQGETQVKSAELPKAPLFLLEELMLDY